MLMDRAVVVVQLLLMVVILFPLPSQWPSITAIVVFVLAEIILFWVVLHNRFGNWSIFVPPIKKGKLIESGPYAVVRHPMYTGLLLFYLSILLWSFTPLRAVLYLLLLVILMMKVEREEARLIECFDDYLAYTRRARYRLIPGIW